jgi:DNA mismatch repair protein MutS
MKYTFKQKDQAEEYYKLYETYSKKYNKIAVLYELGGFYEIFGIENDQEKICNISEICNEIGLMKTRANKKIKENNRGNPLKCGFPSSCLDDYIKKFIMNNFTVIVYSQRKGENIQGKKDRYLEKIVSPGTYVNTNGDFPEQSCKITFVYIEKIENYILSLSTIDMVTGQVILHFIVGNEEHASDSLSKILNVYLPNEIIVNETKADAVGDKIMKILLKSSDNNLQKVPVNKILFRNSYQEEWMKKVYGETVEELDLEHYPSLVVSLILALQFAHEHDENILSKISKPKIINEETDVYMSLRTIRNLNILDTYTENLNNSNNFKNNSNNNNHNHHKSNEKKYKSLLDIINFTDTPQGKRLLKSKILSPTFDVKIIENSYNEIESMMKSLKNNPKDIEENFSDYPDLEFLHRKISLKKIKPTDFIILENTYVKIFNLMKLKLCTSFYRDNMEHVQSFKKYIKYYREILDLEPLNLIKNNLISENVDNEEEDEILNNEKTQSRNLGFKVMYASFCVFKQCVYPEIDELLMSLRQTFDEFEKYEKVFLDILGDDTSLKISKTPSEGYFFLTTNKRYCVIQRESQENFDVKKQTTSVKLFNNKIREFSENIKSLEEKLNNLIKEKFNSFCENISTNYNEMLKFITDYSAHVDFIKSSAKCAMLYNYCKPKIHPLESTSTSNTYSYVDAKGMRHPILERVNENNKFIPNDVSLGKNLNGMLVYGVNGIGKSIFLKSIGLCIVLAQAGLYVPCEDFVYYPFKKLLTKIANNDNLYKGQSTFTYEMMELKGMLDKADENTIILADELCSGTETNSAISIVASSVMQLSKKKANFVFTTHLHQLVDIISNNYNKINNVKHFHLSIEIIDGEIIYGRKIKEGSGNDTYGIEIAKQLKVGDSEFIKNAINIRRFLTNTNNEILPTKQSQYNKDVYIDKCENCGTTKNLHTHHIEEQKKADENNMIKGIHKNVKYNLKILCEKCHVEVHSKST